jgi:hypothetical protein
MDFIDIRTKETRSGVTEIYPTFINDPDGKDLMIRGSAFYAVWDEESGLWVRNEFRIQQLVDQALREYEEDFLKKYGDRKTFVRYLRYSDNNTWSAWKKYVRDSPDRWRPLDNKVIFANSPVKKTDYASRRLPYPLEEGDYSAWDELMVKLYAPEQRHKIEWGIGSIVAGDSKKIQKFLVLYGAAGKGKSTVLSIIEKLFDGYYTTFDGKALGRGTNQFAVAAFKDNPLVAIQHDGDLSRIEDNTTLNSIIGHDIMPIEEKHKAAYSAKIEAMLFMGTNQPVKITDSRSGIIRRLLDVQPTGDTFDKKHYDALMSQINFQLGAIAYHCLQVYLEAGQNYYNKYKPLEMMFQTDSFYNFIETYFDLFKMQDGVTLTQAWKMYKSYCEEAGVERPMQRMRMRTELLNYFREFYPRKQINGEEYRSVFVGFTAEKFKEQKEDSQSFSLVIEDTVSPFDEAMADCLAQYDKDGQPEKKWTNVKTKLSDIDTTKLHWVKVPENHIVIDFDLRDTDGAKAIERNLEAASEWPPTYAEVSRSGGGVHLHYTYTADTSELASSHADGVEVKVYRGDSALRRQLSRCNNVPITTLASGLKLKEKKVHNESTIKSEQGLRALIERNLRKEIHPGTKPSLDFIKKILDEAYESGMEYDLTDMRPRIIAFANNSTNQAANCLKIIKTIEWSSENPGAEISSDVSVKPDDERLAFFDLEVYSNLFVVCWKFEGDSTVVKMINPSPHEVQELFKLKLVGFYNRRYDNHILYAASMDSTPEKLFKLSDKIINSKDRSGTFGAAYNLSYADVWDFSTERMSLKEFEIKLGIFHLELDHPWDQPVPEEKWPQVVEYCVNDVIATEEVFNYRKGDFIARQILAQMSGLTVNDTTQRHTAQIVFGDDKNPHKQFVYSDLSDEFPGYKFELGKSEYKGEDPGEGGYVYAEPGIYSRVAVLDVASMHPASIEALNMFGPYTEKFVAIRKARVAIKRKEYAVARELLGPELGELLDDAESHPETGDALAYALKIAINIVYGLTSAKFDNPFRDIRNIDNIAAKRGALFMIDLKDHLQNAGWQVVHIKTDSVKIPNATQEVIDLVTAFGEKYGYEFEHEVTYDKLCLVNDAVYVAALSTVPWDDLSKPFPGYVWSATGAQFQHPYVFKTLFSGEEIEFKDLCEAKSVQSVMYLDMTGSDLDQPDKTKMRHVGKTGLFVPVKKGGGVLYRVKDDKYYAVSGTKGYLWMEAGVAKDAISLEDIDMSYFEKLKDKAIETIEQFGSYSELIKPLGV